MRSTSPRPCAASPPPATRPCRPAPGPAAGARGARRAARSQLGLLLRNPGEHAAVVAQRLADADTPALHAEFANAALVLAAAHLDHRDRLPDLAFRLEV